MDFRFDKKKYFGKATVDLNPQSSCPIQDNDFGMYLIFLILVWKINPQRIFLAPLHRTKFLEDTSSAKNMWRYAPMSCDSKIERVTDSANVDWMVVSKQLKFGPPVWCLNIRLSRKRKLFYI